MTDDTASSEIKKSNGFLNVQGVKIDEESVEVTEVNKTEQRNRCGVKLPYSAQRQSEQMETFVENFIKPKLTTDKLSSSGIPKDFSKRVSKKKNSFNLIILGEKGLGKSTFIKALVKDKIIRNEEEKALNVGVNKVTENHNIVEQMYVLMKDGQKVYLNIIEVPEFGVQLNNETVLVDILQYVDNSFEESFKQECSLDRSATEDLKIHCCLYFISPYGHSLKPLDIHFFKQFQTKINIIPVIAKCDAFTKTELQQFKNNILKDFQKHGIDLFEYLNYFEPIEDEIDNIKEICEDIKNNIPFALTSSIDITPNGRGKSVFGREYPWGIVNTQHTSISDFEKLENILTRSHINYFKMLTKTVHYENFRMNYILERVQ